MTVSSAELEKSHWCSSAEARARTVLVWYCKAPS